MSEMTPVEQFRAFAKKAESDAEAMQGFPGSGYPAVVARKGLEAIAFLEARNESLEAFVIVASRFHGIGSVCEQNRNRRRTTCEICDGLAALKEKP